MHRQDHRLAARSSRLTRSEARLFLACSGNTTGLPWHRAASLGGKNHGQGPGTPWAWSTPLGPGTPSLPKGRWVPLLAVAGPLERVASFQASVQAREKSVWLAVEASVFMTVKWGEHPLHGPELQNALLVQRPIRPTFFEAAALTNAE